MLCYCAFSMVFPAYFVLRCTLDDDDDDADDDADADYEEEEEEDIGEGVDVVVETRVTFLALFSSLQKTSGE